MCRLRRNCSSFSTCTPHGHLQEPVPSQPAHRTVTYRNQFLLNPHTGRSLTGTSSFSTCIPDSHLQEPVPSQPGHRTVTYTEYYTRCCINAIRSPDDEHRVARSMYRIIIINVLHNVIAHPVGHLPRAIVHLSFIVRGILSRS